MRKGWIGMEKVKNVVQKIQLKKGNEEDDNDGNDDERKSLRDTWDED